MIFANLDAGWGFPTCGCMFGLRRGRHCWGEAGAGEQWYSEPDHGVKAVVRDQDL